MSIHQRRVLGIILILMALLLLFSQSNRTYYIDKESIRVDVEERISKIVGGRDNFDEIMIEVEKKIGNKVVLLLTYQIDDHDQRQSMYIYKEIEQGKYEYYSSDDTARVDGIPNTTRVSYSYFGNNNEDEFPYYLIVYGYIKDNEPHQYEIYAGNMRIREEFERNTFFVREYIVENTTANISVQPYSFLQEE